MEFVKQYTETGRKTNWKLEKVINPRIYTPLVSFKADKNIGQQFRKITDRTIVSLAGRGKHYAVGVVQDAVNATLDPVFGRKRGRTLDQSKYLIKDGMAVVEEAPFVNRFGYEVRDYLALSVKTPTIKPQFYNINNIQIDQVREQEFVDFHAIMKVTEKKNILMTQVQGRDRSRKEYISGGDLYIQVQGMIVHSNADSYPTEEVEKLYSILKSSSIVSVNSPFLSLFGITGMVITDFELPQNTSSRNVQNYSFSAVFEPSIPIQLAENKVANNKLEKELKRKSGWMSLTDRIKNDAVNFGKEIWGDIKDTNIEVQI